RCALERRRAAHALAERDADAGGLALERSHDELAVAHEVEAHPVHVVERVIQERGAVRRVRDEIALALEQGRELPCQCPIELRARAEIALELMHACSLPRAHARSEGNAMTSSMRAAP